MKKKKLLFYGNCHLSSIAKWLDSNYSNVFEITRSDSCGLVPFHDTYKNFAVWIDSEFRQKFYAAEVHKKIKEADFVIFQQIETKAIDILRTEYLIDNVVEGESILVPNTRFAGYPMCSHTISPYVKYIYNNITQDKQEIFNYLTKEDDPKFHEILFEEYNKSMSENRKRFNCQSLNCRNKIDTLDFIEKEWKNHFLFGNHHHPIGLYWTNLLQQLFEILNEPLDLEKIKRLVYPNMNVILNVKQFNFFNKIFPNIKIPDEIQKVIDLDINNNTYANHGLTIIQEPLKKFYGN